MTALRTSIASLLRRLADKLAPPKPPTEDLGGPGPFEP